MKKWLLYGGVAAVAFILGRRSGSVASALARGGVLVLPIDNEGQSRANQGPN